MKSLLKNAEPSTSGGQSGDGKGGKVLSENIRRLRFMQDKTSSAAASSRPNASPQGGAALSARAFHQQQLRLLQQQQKQFYELQRSQGDKKHPKKEESAASAAPPASLDPHVPAPSASASSSAPPLSRKQLEEVRSRQLEELKELRRHWCAPGSECAEDIYELQKEEDMQLQLQMGSLSFESKRQAAALVVTRRAYGGMNPYVETTMRSIVKKALQLERRQEEEREAKRWQAAHSGRQNISDR
ncbi:hypothetical protein BESB_048930 [Besnoitia besnoiti]|uniref:Uncharacterized protein n=1 Tax=Besnoitia besnoiti TaxID=94643 RepID=A0A2A9MKA3_BESBE|nr:hypothetical protein BESB_048930 [Besnoitia besnoiti]PFH36701.1 hypothetical protein BESB_048930 [Besnoitia besnoiti]